MAYVTNMVFLDLMNFCAAQCCLFVVDLDAPIMATSLKKSVDTFLS